MSGQTVERCQPVNDIVSLRILLQQFVEMLAGGYIIAHIHQRDRKVEVFFGRFELRSRSPFKMLAADTEMHGGAINEFLTRAGQNLLKVWFRLIELVFLHSA